MSVDPLALWQGVVAVLVAGISAGWWSGHKAKGAIQAHGMDEMEHLNAIREELELLRSAQSSTNQLMVQTFDSMDRRLRLVENRLT